MTRRSRNRIKPKKKHENLDCFRNNRKITLGQVIQAIIILQEPGGSCGKSIAGFLLGLFGALCFPDRIKMLNQVYALIKYGMDEGLIKCQKGHFLPLVSLDLAKEISEGENVHAATYALGDSRGKVQLFSPKRRQT